MTQAMDFKTAQQNAEMVEREQMRQKTLDALYEERFRQQKISFLFEYIKLRAEHQLQKFGSAVVSLRDYQYDFYSNKINDGGKRYSYADTFKDLLLGSEESAGAFRKWLEENGLSISSYEEDDGFGMRSWLVIKIKIK